jgi:hypothetical protein
MEITSGSRLDYQLSDPITFVQSVHFRYDNQAQRDSPYDIGRHELNYDWKAESPKWRRAGFMRGHKLMMEETLGVELPRPARLTRTNIYAAFEGEGELLEAGAFAIDKRFNAPAFAEILTHLMLFVDDPNFSRDFNRNSRAFYTYNDYPQLYSGLGFVKIGDPYMTEHNEKTGKEHSWWILRALPEDLSAAIQRISTYRKNMDLENLEKIRNQILSSEP